MLVQDIKTRKPFNELFPVDPTVLGAIQEHMMNFGYDVAHPIILWEEKNIVVDGNVRLQSAINVGLEDIPVILKKFSSEDEALEYAIHTQRDRRNLTDADIMRCVEVLDKRKKSGERTDLASSQAKLGKSSQQTAEVVGTSRDKVEKTRTILDHADEQTKADIKDGKVSINKAYQEAKEVKKQSSKKIVFNRTNENIEWAKWTWNPVVGCKHGCPYCYARDIATRFYKNFTPTFFTDRLILDDLSNIPKPKIINEDVRDKNVFVCSMADLFGEWVRQEWIDNVLENVEKAKDWNFVFLTKNPKRYLTTDFPKNAWVGATVDCQERLKPTLDVFKELAEKGKKPTVTFISFEPLREEILIDEKIEYLDLIIIGGQSSNTKEPARQPEWLWVEDLVIKARQYDVLVYFKPNLTVRPKELPQG